MFTWCIIQGFFGARDRKPTSTSLNQRGVSKIHPQSGQVLTGERLGHRMPACTQKDVRESFLPLLFLLCDTIVSILDSFPAERNMADDSAQPQCSCLKATPEGRIIPIAGRIYWENHFPINMQRFCSQKTRGGGQAMINVLSGQAFNKRGKYHQQEWIKIPREEIKERRQNE